MVVCSLTNCELLFEILERVEAVGSVEFLVILSVTTLNFAVMSWCIRLNQLVPNTELRQCVLKECWLRIFCIGKAICKFAAIVRLDALDGIRKTLNTVLNEQG